MKSVPLIVLTGPTACGKSALALTMAKKLGGEIVSADSMQFYRHLDLGTAKPTAEERKSVPHHLVDCCDPCERLSVFRFRDMADEAIAAIHSRGRAAIVCGGSGFYLRALLEELDDLPGDEKLRRELDVLYDRDDAMDSLKQRMEREDPAALRALGKCRRKLIRALEVKLLAGRSILELQNNRTALRYPFVWGRILMRDREDLKKRIALRTSAMLSAGWQQEAADAADSGLADTPTARQAIGYDVLQQVRTGHLTIGEAQEKIACATWQFARRQITYFRHHFAYLQQLPMPCDEELLCLEAARFLAAPEEVRP